MTPSPGEITLILKRWDSDRQAAAEALTPVVYGELRKLAASRLAGEAAGHTLQPTALVHEAWLKLTKDENRRWNGRSHFFAAAAEAMRRILVDSARRKRALRHGGGQQRIDIAEIVLAAPNDSQILVVNDALEKFATVDRQKAELVKLRYFAGLTIDEAAGVLGISAPTAKRYWAYARAWLFEEITTSDLPPGEKDS